ncbi:VOC family protein [Terrimonas alba]|uniref:VOC family protein n=1 Tax=Terrimonas alba TaxID=3349636 RepID=UPI0035F346E8
MNIFEVQLQTANLEETKQFYHSRLGMDLMSSNNNELKISAGLSTLIFTKANKNHPFYHFAFNIPPHKFEEAFEWARTTVSLLPVTSGNPVADFRSWNAKAFYFFDNNNNIVEFIARFDLSHRSDKTFDGSSVVSISEIGLVGDSAKTYSEQLMTDYGLSYFSRQAPADDFVALGDDNGLFIVVNDQRNWYPTQKKSEKHFALVKAEINGKLCIVEMKGE